MGKKQKKPGQGREKTEKKTAKAAEKKARREEKKLDLEDDIDSILAKIQKDEAKKVEVVVEDGVPRPSPRCNAAVVLNPNKDSEMILHGGEFYNGDKTFVYGDLYRFSIDKQEWRLVSSPNSPPPRSGHQAVAWKNSLFIFGGEFTSPNQERFHHYKDLWRLDLTTNRWEQLDLKNGPTARSGHRMALYKHKVIIFGGFYDSLREVRYYNDLHVLDLDDYKWQEIKPKPGAMWPAPRSACQLAVHQDEVFLYGGYFKDHSADPEGNDRGVVFSDLWSLDPRTWEWNKVKRLGFPPSARAGFSLCVHKKRAILFGGVVDTEEKGGDVLRSTFLNDLYVFQMDRRRWYPLVLRDKKAKQPGTKKQDISTSAASLEDEAENDEEELSAADRVPKAGSDGDGDDNEEVMSGRRRRRLRKKQGRSFLAPKGPEHTDAPAEEEELVDEYEDEDEAVGGEGANGRAGPEVRSSAAETQERQLHAAERAAGPSRAAGASGSAGALGRLGGAAVGESEVHSYRKEALASSRESDGAVADPSAELHGEESRGEGAAGREPLGTGATLREATVGVGAMSLNGPGRPGANGGAHWNEAQSSGGAQADSNGSAQPTAPDAEPEQTAHDGDKASSAPDLSSDPKASWPCGRMNAAGLVGGNTLYLWGGAREVEDKEVTLDDLYALDLNKLDTWHCLVEPTESAWTEVEDEDDGEDDEDGEDGGRRKKAGDAAGEAEDEEEEEEEEEEGEEEQGPPHGALGNATAVYDRESDFFIKESVLEGPSAAEAAIALLKGENLMGAKKLSRKERRAAIDRLRTELGLADADRTPQPGETLRDFFARTTGYWQQAAYERTQNVGKDLRRDGFDLCESRYRELKPVLVELEKLQQEQKAEEAASAKAARPKPAGAPTRKAGAPRGAR